MSYHERDAEVRREAECYRGPEDLQAPEMASLARRLETEPACQQWLEALDRERELLVEALQDVPVPADLASRLLASLTASQPAEPAQLVQPAQTDRTAQPDQPTAAQPALAAPETVPTMTLPPASSTAARRTRRWWLAAASVGGLVAAGLWCLSLLPPTGLPTTADQLGLQASRWESLLDAQRWRDGEPPGLQKPAAVRPHVVRWQYVDLAPLDSRAVVFDLRAGRHPLRLYALDVATSYQLPANPLRMLEGTGNALVGAWQDGDKLFVLVGDRRDSALHSWIELPRLTSISRPKATRA